MNTAFLLLTLAAPVSMAQPSDPIDTCGIPQTERKVEISCKSVYRSLSGGENQPGLLPGGAMLLFVRSVKLIQSTVDENNYCLETASEIPTENPNYFPNDPENNREVIYVPYQSTVDVSSVPEEEVVQMFSGIQESLPMVTHPETYLKGWMLRENSDGSEGVDAALFYSETNHTGLGVAKVVYGVSGISPNMTCEEP